MFFFFLSSSSFASLSGVRLCLKMTKTSPPPKSSFLKDFLNFSTSRDNSSFFRHFIHTLEPTTTQTNKEREEEEEEERKREKRLRVVVSVVFMVVLVEE